jgi:hypothetical protein
MAQVLELPRSRTALAEGFKSAATQAASLRTSNRNLRQDLAQLAEQAAETLDMATVSAATAPIAGAAVAGVVDAIVPSLGPVAPSIVAAVITTGAGVAMRSPALAAAGSGMLAGSAYTIGAGIGAAVKGAM